ncbi:MAG TPA: nicotinate phosphoribosyltransferase [Treponema sp.]|jgi:nicotinate phosphoribosyltransferase|nr:nicotinate phosphoribosyltransferase [Treponema sp.]HCA20413.1 nicotinate phosphoribosyltransferase [Treponema sp.]
MEGKNKTSALFTDFYELTMAQGYWKKSMNGLVVFDVFFRRQPFNGGFSIFAGIETLIDAITSFSFTEDDISFLRSQGMFEEGFLDYLKDFHFSGDLYAFEEGELIFPQEPVVRIHARLIEAQIVEGLVLNHCNFQSLIATKTARMWLASAKGSILEFGLRRAQGTDGALSATRAAYIGGASATSNTAGGKKFGIPVTGTMAHSWVLSFPTELEAFTSYAELYPDKSIFLIDTYDTLRSGIKNAIKAGALLYEKGHSFGVRLDSGDIAYLSAEVRKELDKAGFKDATISVSNDLSEEIISTLVSQKAPIDSWGIGTQLATGGTESSFTGVYKMCARTDNSTGKLLPVMKFSDNPAKNTNPGVKNVFRLYDEEGMARADIIALEDEEIECGKEYLYHHTMIDYRQFHFTASSVRPLLKKRLENGKRLSPPSTEKERLQESRKRMMDEMETFDDSYKRILNPHIYKVSITEKLKDLKMEFIKGRQESVFQSI